MTSLLTLDTIGKTSDPKIMVSRILSYLFTSDLEKTVLFKTTTVSMGDILKNFYTDPDGYADAINRRLETVFQNYFGDVVVDTRSEALDVKNPTKFSISIYVRFVLDNQQYSVGSLLNFENSVFDKIINIINTGEA